MPGFFLRAALSVLVAGAASNSLADDRDARPLPDARAFLDEVRRNIRSDDALLEQYTFTEKRIEKRLDGGGGVKKIKTETF